MLAPPDRGIDALTAVILCGGEARRLRPLSALVPKPLVPLAGRPILGRLLDDLARQGITRFVIAVGSGAAAFSSFASRELRRGHQVVVVDSGAAAMSDRLIAARRHCPGRVLVCYGDTLADVDLRALTRRHRARAALATVTVVPLRAAGGIAEVAADGRVRRFREKPLLPHWMNVGFVLCEPAALDRLRSGTDLDALLHALARAGRLAAHRHRGHHLTFNTADELVEARARFRTWMRERRR